MRIFFYGALLVLAFSVQAKNSPADRFLQAVVKVEFSLPNYAHQPSRGSGLVFRHQSRLWVLTVEHIVMNDLRSDQPRQAQCRVAREDEAPVPCRLVWSDWGLGLALLELTQTPPWKNFRPVDWAELQAPPAVSPSTPVMLAGYSVQNQGLTFDPLVKIEDLHFASSYLLDVEEMIQLRGSRAEFGLSGGIGVLPTQAQPFLGLISHQSRRSTEPNINHIYLIGSAQIAQTLERYFADPAGFRVGWIEDAEARYERPAVSLCSENIRLHWVPEVSEIHISPGSGCDPRTRLLPERRDYFESFLRSAKLCRRQDEGVFIGFWNPLQPEAGFREEETFALIPFLRALKSSRLQPLLFFDLSMSFDWDQTPWRDYENIFEHYRHQEKFALPPIPSLFAYGPTQSQRPIRESNHLKYAKKDPYPVTNADLIQKFLDSATPPSGLHLSATDYADLKANLKKVKDTVQCLFH